MADRGAMKRFITGIYWREKALVAKIRPYLLGAESVIDIGAGGCRLARLIGQMENVRITAVDVVDHNVTDIPLTLYNGSELPFSDQAFDVSILVFVLHHAADPAALLRETARVTRTAILIVEDAPINVLERNLWKAWDYTLNHAVVKDIDIAHHARNVSEWKELLTDAELSPAESQTFRISYPVLGTYTHVLFHIPLH
jgi:SAM-dependent methyltransferase